MAPITHQQAHHRAQLGWETRRRFDPDLKNIYKTGHKEYEWRRPNNDVVPIRNLNDRQVARIAPAISATDAHLRSDRHINAYIRGSGKMFGPEHSYINNSSSGVPFKVIRNYKSIKEGIPDEVWGNKDFIAIDKRTINRNLDTYTPGGVLAHEIGHAVDSDLFQKRDREFNDAFQYKRNKARREHVAYGTYQASGPHEDFAEAYRTLIGVPIDTRHTGIHEWKDDNSGSREKYMRRYLV